MTFVNGKNLIENNIEAQQKSLNPFAGIGQFLDAKFNTVFAIEGSSSSQSLANNPFGSLNQVQQPGQMFPEEITGGHSINYAAAPNSVFDLTQNNSTRQFNDNFRNARFGNLDFES